MLPDHANPWLIAANELDPPSLDSTPSEYLVDPVRWAWERGGGFVWSKQREILESVRDNRYTAVKSCYDAGKSWTAAEVVAWWIDSHQPGTAAGVTTAPTGDQVKKILWKEINRVHRNGPNRKGKLPGRTNQTEWWIGADPVAFGRKPSDYDQAAFQGIHEEFVLVVFDEADGITQSLYDEAQGLMANEGCRMLLIGNPYDPQSAFAKACRPDSLYNVITISAWDTPNFTGEQVPSRLSRLLVSRQWVEERRKDWGEGTPLWQSKVEAEFPVDTEDGVVPFTWAQRCRELDVVDEGDHLNPVELGVDIAAGGADQTVIRCRRGRRAAEVWRMSSNDPVVVCERIIEAITATGATRVKVDTIGWGWGLAGMLVRARQKGEHNARVSFVNVAEKAKDPERFTALRDEIWWEIGRMMSMNKRWDLSLCDDRTLADLTAPKYSTPGGRIKVEKKEDTKERLGRSPDDADALLLAFYEPDVVVEEDPADYVFDEEYQPSAA